MDCGRPESFNPTNGTPSSIALSITCQNWIVAHLCGDAEQLADALSELEDTRKICFSTATTLSKPYISLPRATQTRNLQIQWNLDWRQRQAALDKKKYGGHVHPWTTLHVTARFHSIWIGWGSTIDCALASHHTIAWNLKSEVSIDSRIWSKSPIRHHSYFYTRSEWQERHEPVPTFLVSIPKVEQRCSTSISNL